MSFMNRKLQVTNSVELVVWCSISELCLFCFREVIQKSIQLISRHFSGHSENLRVEKSFIELYLIHFRVTQADQFFLVYRFPRFQFFFLSARNFPRGPSPSVTSPNFLDFFPAAFLACVSCLNWRWFIQTGLIAVIEGLNWLSVYLWAILVEARHRIQLLFWVDHFSVPSFLLWLLCHVFHFNSCFLDLLRFSCFLNLIWYLTLFDD